MVHFINTTLNGLESLSIHAILIFWAVCYSLASENACACLCETPQLGVWSEGLYVGHALFWCNHFSYRLGPLHVCLLVSRQLHQTSDFTLVEVKVF